MKYKKELIILAIIILAVILAVWSGIGKNLTGNLNGLKINEKTQKDITGGKMSNSGLIIYGKNGIMEKEINIQE